MSKKSGASTNFKNRAGDKLKLPKLEFPVGIRRVGMSVVSLFKVDTLNFFIVFLTAENKLITRVKE